MNRSTDCDAPGCLAGAVALVRITVRPLEGYADPVAGHTRFTVCDEHLVAVEANAGRLPDLVTVTVSRYA